MHEISTVSKETRKFNLIDSVSLVRKTLTKNLIIPFFIINFLLVNMAYFAMNYIKRSTLTLDVRYFKLLLLFYVIWLIISVFTKKFKISSYLDFKHAFLLIAKSNVFILYLLSIFIVLKGLYAFSRLQLFGTCLILFLLEISVFSVFYNTYGKSLIHRNVKDRSQFFKFGSFSITKLFYDFILITISFFVLNYFKRNTFNLSPSYEELLLVVYALWLLSSLFTRKFENRNLKNYYYAIAPYLKSFILMIAVTSVIVFAFRLFFFSRLQIFGTFTLLIILEIIFYYIYFISRVKNGKYQDIETYQEVNKIIEQENLPFELEDVNREKHRKIHSVKDKLKTKYLRGYSSLFNFINSRINLLKIDESDTSVLNTRTFFNIQTIDDHSVSLFVNLHKINNIRWLNRYFLEVHKKIYNGGFFISRVDTIATHKKRFYKKYPKLLANIFYPVNFLFKRALPKLPGIKRIYFIITRGKSRAISKAEALGRLYFCGFKVVDARELEDSLYFIAQRVKNPSVEKNPSYGPTIKLRRIGLNAEIMYVNKFRTMHPYSEFLQEYIYDNNKLQDNGKFQDDFRLTTWGKLFRKLWIDELPQLINFWRGDLTLVGVRALSQHYFDLYPKDLKDFRIQFKPGLVPPYYADMPKSFEEIVTSERKYLEQKQMHPFSTDVKYFFKIFYNIIFKHARSQ